MTDARGATAAEWFHFDFVLGLGDNLLPCVPAAPGVRVVAGSAIEGKVGKIPSAFNHQGEAHGLTEWQKRPILGNEVALWAQDRRLNLCVRTGPISGVYAFDVDIEHLSGALVRIVIEGAIGTQPTRSRSNSSKFLIPFRMDESCKKRKIKLDDKPRGPAIELLADGQQFVAAGSHSSGVRYQWQPGLPDQLPILTLAQVNSIWETLTKTFAISKPTPAPTATAAVSGTTTTTLADISESEWAQLLDALRFLLPHAGDNDTWSQIGYALLSIQHTRPAHQLWIDFSTKAAGYEAGAPERWWETHGRQEPRSDYRHIFTLARKRGWGATSQASDFPAVPAKAQDKSTEPTGPVGPDATAAADGSDILAPPQDKPVVRLIDREFSKIIDQLETVIKPEIYTQGTQLVRLTPGHEDSEIERSSDQLMLVSVTKAYARKRMGELAMFMKFAPVKATWYETSPSAEHINTLIEQGAWRKLRPLDAIARAPFIRRDGSICDTAGYDRISRALFIPGADYPAIPRDPSYDDAAAALGRLRRVFHQFPWTADAFESAFLAHVLSEAGRLAFNRCPMFFYNAPTAGTGKTLLQKAASIIAHGTIPALRPWVANPDEVRKTIYASLLAGDRSLLFDNVPDGVKIRSSELCAAITAETWQDRKLGVSEAPSVANNAVFSASGNNVNPFGDLSRRSIIIRLDANLENVEGRHFDIRDLESYLIKNRPQLLVDVLTIIRAYHTQTEASLTMPEPLGSFEQWSHFVREPLIWLGMADPVETQKREADDDKDSLRTLFGLLCARFGANSFTGVDIAYTAGGLGDPTGELTQALIASGCQEPSSPSKVGYWLRGNRDKIFNGQKLVKANTSKIGVRWKFLPITERKWP